MSDGGEGESLEYTPTWIVAISLAAERRRTEVQIKSLTRQKYVSAENGGGMNVPWIEIHLLPGKSLRLDSHHILWRVSSSQFQFRTSQGQFLTCTGLGCSVSATAGSPSTTETFDVDRNNDRVHIKTTIGAYLQVSFSIMSNFWGLGFQQAPNNLGREIEIGPSYPRSISLNEVKASIDHQDPVSLCKIEDVIPGDLQYHSSLDDNVVRHTRGFGPNFQAKVLGDIDNKQDADMVYQVTVDFYPSLHRVLAEKKTNNNFFSWTYTLNQGGIYGAVYISRYPFNYEKSVWRAFSELWGPLSNTFHHSNGEMGISLCDLKVIGGLPILGIPYEEFIPPNKKLVGGTPYPSTTAELLRLHTQIYNYLKVSKFVPNQII
ncbi:hypothetical protein CsatB_023548 [Cannabis sativa]